jgi:membrane protein YqaA with SNARE-associated domain
MSRLITPLQAMSARVAVMFLTTVALLRQRVAPLRAEPERGGGMTTLEMVLLGVAGVAAAGLVIGAIATSIGKSVNNLP